MEIRYTTAGDPQARLRQIDRAAARANVAACLSSADASRIRFTLRHSWEASSPVASLEAHDAVIVALLKLDPEATIRTARAVYEGLADYEAQLKARRESK